MPGLYGTLQLGPMSLLDAAFDAKLADDRTVKVTVQASPSLMNNTGVERRGEDLLGLKDRLIPVVFSDKARLSGYYRVTGVDLTHWSYPGNVGPRVVVATADLTLTRVGFDNTVDLESRLSGAQTRTNDFGLDGVRWQAPPGGHFGYLAPSTPQPLRGIVPSAEGPITVYRGLPFGVSPRWGCALADYGRHRVRFLDGFTEEAMVTPYPGPTLYPGPDFYPGGITGGLERLGTDFPTTPTGWVLHNSMVMVKATTDGLLVSVFDGTAWQAKGWRLTAGTYGDQVLGAPERVSVIRNAYEAITVRLLWSLPAGRVVCDLTVRRGARWVEGYVQSDPDSYITVALVDAEPGTLGVGYLAAANPDPAGLRYIVGSSRLFTANQAGARIGRWGSARFDFFTGAVIPDPPYGEQADDIMARYLGTPGESVTAVRR